jgi:TolB-like protein/Tfp pilus assembly protein PilF
MFWPANTSYEFGPFRVDERERRLLRGDEVVPLRPKAFDVLLVLVQNSGRFLSKDEVMKLVWPDTAVEEGNLARNISTLRNALGETARKSQYIETVPWRGYRFVANVKKVRSDQPRPPIDSLAVLPFVNVNANERSEYLADGITESLITALARLTNLRVTSRNSAFRYKGRDTDTRAIARELKVAAVVMGRVSESDHLLSISLELVNGGDDSHIWGAQYIRRPEELFAAQDRIAREIADQLRLELSGGDRQRSAKRHTESNEAYLHYLKGRYHFNKLTLDGVRKSAHYFQQAIEKDPNYALAYAGLGDCHNYLNEREAAKEALLKAIQLDNDLGEAHASLGFFRFLYDWDFAGAEKEFVKAAALSPNYAEAHHWYGIYLANLGRHDEALKEAEMAVERDPLSLLMNMTAALNAYLARDYDRAVEQLQKVIEMDSNFPPAHSVLGCVYMQRQMHQEALAKFERVLDLCAGAPQVEASVKVLMAQAYARCGQQIEVRKLLDEVASVSVSHYSVAGVYAALREHDKAFAELDKAYERHDMQLVSLKVDPTLDDLRGDPRFLQLVHRVGLPR